MNYSERKKIYRQIESDRNTKVLAFVTGERLGLQTKIAGDAIGPFVSLLDEIGPTPKISLILDTNGGQTSAAWRLINLIRSFADEVEIIIPTKAMSAGTLMAIGSDKIVMTKQAALGPIDPSLDNHPLGPTIMAGQQQLRVPVSAEAVRGYLDEVKKDITDPAVLATVWTDLASRIHPIVLGEIFRLGGQIRSMAKNLIGSQVKDARKQDNIINLLCSDSGSHDYTINRRHASDLGLNIEKPSAELYRKLTKITKSYNAELKTFEPFSHAGILGNNKRAPYMLVRGLIEGTKAGCYGFVSEGELIAPPNPQVPGASISDDRKFEGWRKLP